VPLNVLSKDREVDYHLTDSDAKGVLRLQGHPQLPIGKTAREGCRESTGCTEFFLVESGGAPWSGDETPESNTSVVAEQPVTFRTVERDVDDTAVVP
jgi:long-chain acyl-CoA synthetase